MTATSSAFAGPGRSTGRLAWLITGVAVTAIVLGSTSFSLWFLTAFKPQANHLTQTTRYAGQTRNLTIQLDSGDITLRTGPAGQVEVTRTLSWTGTKPSIDERWTGQGLRILEHCPGSVFTRMCSVGYSIAVPPGVTVNATTDSGTVVASGLDGVLNLTSLSGDVDVTQARSPEVLASSDAGDIRLRFTAAPEFVRAQASAGDVSVAVPRGASYNVQPVAGAGNTFVSVDNTPSARRYISATSDSGDVRVVYN